MSNLPCGNAVTLNTQHAGKLKQVAVRGTTAWYKFKKWLMSPAFQSSVQVTTGKTYDRNRHGRCNLCSTSYKQQSKIQPDVNLQLLAQPMRDLMYLHAGQFVTALWVFIPRLTFPNSCLATVFYSVGMVMVSQNGHIGSRLKAMVVIPGSWWVGALGGGVTVSGLLTT